MSEEAKQFTINILHWISTYDWLSLIVQVTIAYHVFFLSKTLSARNKLENKETAKRKAEELLLQIIKEKLNREVVLINISRYFKDYPSTNLETFRGYSYIKSEIKTTRFDGIEFFSSSLVDVYRKEDGSLTFKNAGNRIKAFTVYPVSVVPYEWIEHIDLDGDEWEGGVPLFYCHFKGQAHWDRWRTCPFPYKKGILYYKFNENHNEKTDPVDWQYTLIQEPISKD